MENQATKTIRVKVGFQPKPAGWTKNVTPVDTEEGITLSEFLKRHDIPYQKYPSRLLNNEPIDERDFGDKILQRDDTLMFSTDITGNLFEQCSQWCRREYVKFTLKHYC